MYENVFTSTQLKTNLREVKEAAEKDIVYITENGVIAYVLCSVEIWNREMRRAELEGSWEVAVEGVLRDAGRECAEGCAERRGERLRVSSTLESSARKLGFDLNGPVAREVIEYVSQAPAVGREIPERVPRWHPYGDHARTFRCEGVDLVYEHEEASGQVLLCGGVASVESQL